ncbi:MAG: SDR family oxidoreductase [Pseudobutyrivibrio sp.]|nr:SDR family oxidoreductase [Pseudobutyrivibrio sp.]
MESRRENSGRSEQSSAVVVGANSTIGIELIPLLSEKYSDIVVTESGKNFELLKNLVEKLKIEYPSVNYECVELDVLKKESLEEFSKKLEKRSITSYIYLAGVNILLPALEVDEEKWDLIMDINLKGFFMTAKIIAKKMLDSSGGSILGVASQHGVVANIDRAPYCASKAGLIHLAKELALEWAKYKIRVNIVSPTFIKSEKNNEILESSKGKKEYLSKIPLREYAKPIDVCNAIMYLESDEASIITGQNIILDGGWTIC